MGKMIKALGLNDEVKIYIVDTKDVTETAIEKHDLWPSCASVLGKTMTIALLMGGTLKQDQALTIKIDGNGPIGLVCTDSDGKGNVRGYVANPHVTFSKQGKIDEITTLGTNGYIDVIKDLRMNDLFTSSTELITGDLAQDFSYYLMKSEQIPSVIMLGSKFDVDNTCKVCGGMMVQVLPNATIETISYLEKTFENAPSFSSLLENNSLEDILNLFFKDNHRILESYDTIFNCPCSHEHFKKALLRLGKDTINDLYNDGKDVEAVCHYCNTKYTYSIEEIKQMKSFLDNNIIIKK